jgi:hypothetical protein
MDTSFIFLQPWRRTPSPSADCRPEGGTFPIVFLNSRAVHAVIPNTIE